MAKEYMIPSLNFIWKSAEIIPVARDGQDSAGLRVALRHLKEGGVIGIFPEGGIKQPREGQQQPPIAIANLVTSTPRKMKSKNRPCA